MTVRFTGIPDNWREDQSYQKLPGYNWRIDPYYRLDKEHPRPFMRPQVQALIGKLRKMEMMKQPGTAEEIIFDIAYQQLYSNKQEVRLANIAARVTHLWIVLRGNEDINGVPNPPTISTLEQLKTAPYGTYIVDAPVLKEEVDHIEQRNDLQPTVFEFLDNQELRRVVNLVIATHINTNKPGWQPICSCGKMFAAEEEWGNHVRIRIWRAIKGEFPLIGTEEP